MSFLKYFVLEFSIFVIHLNTISWPTELNLSPGLYLHDRHDDECHLSSIMCLPFRGTWYYTRFCGVLVFFNIKFWMLCLVWSVCLFVVVYFSFFFVRCVLSLFSTSEFNYFWFNLHLFCLSSKIVTWKENNTWQIMYVWYYNPSFIYSNPVVIPISKFTPGFGSIWMNNLMCSGHEVDIALCKFNGWNNPGNCTHSKDVAISCGKHYNVFFYYIALYNYIYNIH